MGTLLRYCMVLCLLAGRHHHIRTFLVQFNRHGSLLIHMQTRADRAGGLHLVRTCQVARRRLGTQALPRRRILTRPAITEPPLLGLLGITNP